MTSTFSPNKLHLEEPANGDYSGTWSTPVNANWSVIDAGAGGTATVALTNANVTLSTSQAQNIRILLTGTITANVQVSFAATVPGFWIIDNATTGAFAVTIGTSVSGTTVTAPQGYKILVFSDGTNVALADAGTLLGVNTSTIINGWNLFNSNSTSTNLRWSESINGSETGGNAGSNLVLNAYSDTGTLIGAVMVITRANGAVGLGKTPGAYSLDTLNGINAPSYAVGGVVLPTSFPGSAQGLVITNGGAPSSQISITAGSAFITGAVGGVFRSTIAVTISTGTSGAGGLDTGAIAQGWYYIYLIDNGTAPAGLISLSSTSPILPSGYTFFTRVGAIPTDSSSNLQRIRIIGNKAQYVVTNSTNTPNIPIVVSGISGSTTTPSYNPYQVRGIQIPPTSFIARIMLGGVANNQYAIVAPNNNYGAATSTTNPPFMEQHNDSYGSGSIMVADMVLENNNIYYASSGSSTFVGVVGWIDSVNAS